jgi:hypothetical protein
MRLPALQQSRVVNTRADEIMYSSGRGRDVNMAEQLLIQNPQCRLNGSFHRFSVGDAHRKEICKYLYMLQLHLEHGITAFQFIPHISATRQPLEFLYFPIVLTLFKHILIAIHLGWLSSKPSNHSLQKQNTRLRCHHHHDKYSSSSNSQL